MWKAHLKSEIKKERLYNRSFYLLTQRCRSVEFDPWTQVSLSVETQGWAPARKRVTFLLSLPLSLTEWQYRSVGKVEHRLISKGSTTAAQREPQVFSGKAGKERPGPRLHKKPQRCNTDSVKRKGRSFSWEVLVYCWPLCIGLSKWQMQILCVACLIA